MMFRLLTSAMIRKTLVRSASLKSMEIRCPWYFRPTSELPVMNPHDCEPSRVAGSAFASTGSCASSAFASGGALPGAARATRSAFPAVAPFGNATTTEPSLFSTVYMEPGENATATVTPFFPPEGAIAFTGMSNFLASIRRSSPFSATAPVNRSVTPPAFFETWYGGSPAVAITTFDASGRSSRSIPTTAGPFTGAFPSWRRSVLAIFSSAPPPTDRTSTPFSALTTNGIGRSPGVSTTIRNFRSTEEIFTALTWGVPTGISEAAVPWATPQTSTTIRNGSFSLKEL
jgi:hypothetical protein